MSLYTWTGNPFVDAGIAAIQVWSGLKEPEAITLNEVKKIAQDILALYVTDAWKKNLFSIFPNNPITNPAVKDKRNSFAAYLNGLISGIEPLGQSGDCMACGRRNVRSRKNRMHIPLTGYEGSHFFPSKTEGADYCESCTFAVQCVPLMLYACGKLALVHSNSHKVMRYWARRCATEVQRQISSRNYTGCFNEKFTNPTNALFHITQDLILSYYEEQWVEENASIRIYHFTNYGQGPDLDIYDLPSPVFRFLASVRLHPRFSDWLQVVRRGYRYNIQEKSEEEYKNYPNSVYERLLSGQSILAYFLDSLTKKAFGDWSLITIYLKEVLQMDDNRITTIKRVADEIAAIIQESPNGKRRLGQVERATNYASFRMVLLRLMHDTVGLKKEAPLFTFDEYVEHLFPDGALGWKETQDLILFRLYEQLHSWLIAEGVVLEEEEPEEEVKTIAEQ
ncbi:type I-B CRISPR-associated protein Cas8b1/Cst1 [candidate division KSB1 bacterium]|nr:MAG: type I-B CRISPR-associated protein Cas8b1/Cst1 [candidate division KSB1 bacterium]